MKDNFPNYLNFHGIDPGRVEPARVDTSPGNDSIRPGMNIGTIGVAGAGRRPAKMTMEQIEVFFRKLLNLEVDNSITFSDDLWYEIQISLSALLSLSISPWVKTADRLPTKDDVDSRKNVMAWHIWYGAEIVDYGLLLDDPAMYIWWAPIPPLPEEVYR